MMQMLATDNQLTISPSIGTLVSSYPVEIQAVDDDIAAQFSLDGGLGYTPVRLNGDSFPFLLGCSSS